ncbi:MAG: O-antigen ligase family protein [Phycisphaerae bacterium]|nr:O-antigen ligase family protein [Phycisphaerae bacterium]
MSKNINNNQLEYTEQMPNRFDLTIEWLMIILLGFMPLALGVVSAWSKMVVVGMTGLMAVVFVAKYLFVANTRFIWTWAYVPIGIFILLTAFQLVELPSDMVESVSSNTYETKVELLQDHIPEEQLDKMTLSFYEYGTADNLRLILAVSTLFVIVVNVYRSSRQIERLLTGITFIAGVIALIAIMQVLTETDKILWLFPSNGKANSGTFLNHSNFGQYMNLSIGAALALVLVKLSRALRHERNIDIAEVIAMLGSPGLRVVWFALIIIILGMASIFLSLTRGGMIALLIAGSFTSVKMAFKRGMEGRTWVITVMTLLAFTCVLYVGFDAVYERLATLRESDKAEGGRMQIIKDISVAWMKFPVFGTGMGTHDVVYPMFDRSTIAALAGHAENEYAQTAEEAGGIGLAALLMTILIIWVNYFRAIKRFGRSHNYLAINSAVFGLGFGILAVMIQSLSDFGQHLPAIGCLTALFGGMIVSIGHMARKTNSDKILVSKTGSGRMLVNFLLLLAVIGIWSWALKDANAARIGQGYFDQALKLEKKMETKQWLADNEDYAELISIAEMAAKADPKNVHYGHWLNVYRWHSISRVADENGQLLMTPDTIDFTEKIVEEFHKLHVLCPTFGPSYSMAGQLEYFILGDKEGVNNIRKGYALSPCDPVAGFMALLLDGEEGNIEQSFAKAQRVLSLDGNFAPELFELYILQYQRPDLAVQLAGDHTGWLSMVADILSTDDDKHELVSQVRSEIETILKEKASQDASANVFASLAYLNVRKEEYAQAAAFFKKALDLEYSQVSWRLARAKCLEKIDQLEDAIKEVKICLRQRSEMPEAKKLLDKLVEKQLNGTKTEI